ncbi:MAG: hypothetical protein HY064_11265 [Bacteroidetes bacterium]|nr:hypothetical protein [Bacteroidota bacterium]
MHIVIGILMIFFALFTSIVLTFVFWAPSIYLTMAGAIPIIITSLCGLSLIVFGITPKLFRKFPDSK